MRSGEVRATGTLEDVEFSSFDRDGRSEGRKAAGGRRLTTPVQLLQLGGTVMEHQGGLTLSAFVTVARETDGGLQVLGGPLGTARVNLVEVVIEAFDDLLLRRGLDERSGVVTLVEAIELAPPVAPATAAPAAAAPRASESRGAAAAIAEPAAPATPPITTATSAPPRPVKTAAAASASAARNAEIPMTGLRRSSPSPAAGVRAPLPPAPEVLPDEDEDEEHESSAALDDSFDREGPKGPRFIDDEALAELAAQTDPDDEIDDDDELASVLRAPPARPLTPARPAVVAPPKVAARPEAAPAKVAAKPEVAAKAADSTDWDAVKAASDRAQAEGEGGDLPRRGDYIDHATFGRCYVERVEESMERISVRVRAGRLVQLSLEYLSLSPIGREGNARLFCAVKRKP